LLLASLLINNAWHGSVHWGFGREGCLQSTSGGGQLLWSPCTLAGIEKHARLQSGGALLFYDLAIEKDFKIPTQG
jgi:hypothetical protein